LKNNSTTLISSDDFSANHESFVEDELMT
jgi:hypothetical protein